MKPATPTLARAINDRRALDLLLEHGPLTAPQLRTLTGLSRPTVSDLIERLSAGGLIEVAGETGAERRGPNARVYGLVPGRAHVAGVDIRRHAVHATVADITGRTVATATRPLPVSGAPSVDLVGVIADAVAEAGGGREPHTVVVAVPGVVDPRTQEALAVGVPGWRADLVRALEARLGTRVVGDNEVNLAAIAEHRNGSAVGRDDFALLWLDDGIGAALVLGGRLRRGASGGAGEVGLLELGGGATFCDMLEADRIAGLDAGVVADLITEAAFALVAVVDPGLVVLGGATGRDGGDGLAGLVAARLNARSPAPAQVRASTVEGNTVLRGAVLTGLDLARDAIYG
ncbi:ROK family transcriptional regulator [Actinomadura kijaniata]|uniref:Putative NBD/HSP70 family sugar kinase n=1 Tax=Actinomadura namibiensis TaxID=182080 RepID=A0A7W3LTM3_ACTNM|nr:ROK family transcriptional regulator [Actinomadura namibiensis]MBA8954096.1 putative NBD/HSP70 family sugar kinase [Actinomadura namibiensis]